MYTIIKGVLSKLAEYRKAQSFLDEKYLIKRSNLEKFSLALCSVVVFISAFSYAIYPFNIEWLVDNFGSRDYDAVFNSGMELGRVARNILFSLVAYRSYSNYLVMTSPEYQAESILMMGGLVTRARIYGEVFLASVGFVGSVIGIEDYYARSCNRESIGTLASCIRSGIITPKQGYDYYFKNVPLPVEIHPDKRSEEIAKLKEIIRNKDKMIAELKEKQAASYTLSKYFGFGDYKDSNKKSDGGSENV